MGFFEDINGALVAHGPTRRRPSRLEVGTELHLLMRWASVPPPPGLAGVMAAFVGIPVVENSDLSEMFWRLLDTDGDVIVCA